MVESSKVPLNEGLSVGETRLCRVGADLARLAEWCAQAHARADGARERLADLRNRISAFDGRLNEVEAQLNSLEGNGSAA